MEFQPSHQSKLQKPLSRSLHLTYISSVLIFTDLYVLPLWLLSSVRRCEGYPVGERGLHSGQPGRDGVHYPADGLLPGVADIRDEDRRDRQQRFTRRLWHRRTPGHRRFNTTGQVRFSHISAYCRLQGWFQNMIGWTFCLLLLSGSIKCFTTRWVRQQQSEVSSWCEGVTLVMCPPHCCEHQWAVVFS